MLAGYTLSLVGQASIWLPQTPPPQGSLISATHTLPLLCQSANPSSPCRSLVISVYLCPFILMMTCALFGFFDPRVHFPHECHCSAPFTHWLHVLLCRGLVQAIGPSCRRATYLLASLLCRGSFAGIDMLSVGRPSFACVFCSC